MQLRGAAAHPEDSTPGWGGGDPARSLPRPRSHRDAANPLGHLQLVRSGSQCKKRKSLFRKARLSTQIKVKLFNKSSPRSRVGEIYFCLIALSRDLEAIFFFAVNLLNSKYNLRTDRH